MDPELAGLMADLEGTAPPPAQAEPDEDLDKLLEELG